jgi:hypothetical protein
MPQPLPTPYIKHHPSVGWQLAPDTYWDKHMPHGVQPEQHLLRLSEDELYAELVCLQGEWAAGTPQSPSTSAAPVMEFNIRPYPPISGLSSPDPTSA